MKLDQQDKRSLLIVAGGLASVNLAASLIAVVYGEFSPLIGVGVIDLVFAGLAVIVWMAHQIFPDNPQSTHDDPDATVNFAQLRQQGRRRR